jgi:hypothetical protein
MQSHVLWLMGVHDLPRGVCTTSIEAFVQRIVSSLTTLTAAAVFAGTAVGAGEVDVHATNDALATNMSTPVIPTAVRKRDSRRARDVAFISILWRVKTDGALSGDLMGRVEAAPRHAGGLCVSEHRKCVPQGSGGAGGLVSWNLCTVAHGTRWIRWLSSLSRTSSGCACGRIQLMQRGAGFMDERGAPMRKSEPTPGGTPPVRPLLSARQ